MNHVYTLFITTVLSYPTHWPTARTTTANVRAESRAKALDIAMASFLAFHDPFAEQEDCSTELRLHNVARILTLEPGATIEDTVVLDYWEHSHDGELCWTPLSLPAVTGPDWVEVTWRE